MGEKLWIFSFTDSGSGARNDPIAKFEDDAAQSTYMDAVKEPTLRCTQRPFDRLRERNVGCHLLQIPDRSSG